MSAATPIVVLPEALEPEGALGEEVLAHLDTQITSAQRLLEVVLEQGAAIRARDVHTVVRLAGILHGEMTRRQLIEQERSRLLTVAGERLGIPAQSVTLTRLSTLMDPLSAQRASALSAHLRGLLHELQREHSCNRALMQIELSFLDHLMKSLALDDGAGYERHGSSKSSTRSRPRGALHVLDLQA